MNPAAPFRKGWNSRPVDLVVTVLLPWLVFTLIVCLFAFAYQEFAPLVWALVVASLLLALLFVTMGVTVGRGVQLALGSLILTSVGVAVPVGLFIETGFMLDFWRLDNGASYQHMNPFDPGSSHSDATLFDFLPGSSVDVQRSLGYMKRGVVYCVAPIRGPKGQNDAPQIWATGKDCCAQLGQFTCGDVDDPSASSGVSVPDDAGYFGTAVRMASSTYDFKSSPGHPIFVRWTASASSYKENLWSSAAMLVVASSTVHFAVSACAGVCLARK